MDNIESKKTDDLIWFLLRISTVASQLAYAMIKDKESNVDGSRRNDNE